jgi:hypothetical protein
MAETIYTLAVKNETPFDMKLTRCSLSVDSDFDVVHWSKKPELQTVAPGETVIGSAYPVFLASLHMSLDFEFVTDLFKNATGSAGLRFLHSNILGHSTIFDANSDVSKNALDVFYANYKHAGNQINTSFHKYLDP